MYQNIAHILFSFEHENRYDQKKILEKLIKDYKHKSLYIRIGFGFTGTIPWRIDIYCKNEDVEDVYSNVVSSIQELNIANSIYKKSIVIKHNDKCEVRGI